MLCEWQSARHCGTHINSPLIELLVTSGTVLTALHILSHLIYTTILWDRHIIIPYFWDEKTGLERLGNFSKVIQVVNDGAKIQTQVSLIPELTFMHILRSLTLSEDQAAQMRDKHDLIEVGEPAEDKKTRQL